MSDALCLYGDHRINDPCPRHDNACRWCCGWEHGEGE